MNSSNNDSDNNHGNSRNSNHHRSIRNSEHLDLSGLKGLENIRLRMQEVGRKVLIKSFQKTL